MGEGSKVSSLLQMRARIKDQNQSVKQRQMRGGRHEITASGISLSGILVLARCEGQGITLLSVGIGDDSRGLCSDAWDFCDGTALGDSCVWIGAWSVVFVFGRSSVGGRSGRWYCIIADESLFLLGKDSVGLWNQSFAHWSVFAGNASDKAREKRYKAAISSILVAGVLWGNASRVTKTQKMCAERMGKQAKESPGI